MPVPGFQKLRMNEVNRTEVKTHAWIGNHQNLRCAGAELTRQNRALNITTRQICDGRSFITSLYIKSVDPLATVLADLTFVEPPMFPSQRGTIERSQHEILGNTHLRRTSA